MINKNELTLICNCDISEIENVKKLYEDKVNSIIYHMNGNNNLEYDIKTPYFIKCNCGDDIESLPISINKNFDNDNTDICISILMPVYNCGKTIRDTLLSCLNQDFPYKYEIIIVDDGSTDNTLEIIKSFDDKRIKLYVKNHSGISDALNLGLSKCNGEYICRMDGDDVMYEYRLSYQYAYMLHNPNCDILASNINRYENNEVYVHAPSLEIIKNNVTIDDLFDKSLNYNFICHPAIFFRKSLYERVINNNDVFYNHEYNLAEDYELYLRLIKNYNVSINTDEICVLRYNVFKHSNEKEQKLIKLRNKLFAKYNAEKLKSYSIGIYYIATGIYKNDFTRFLLSVKNFFPENKKTIVLISDGLNQYDGYIDKENNISIKHVTIIDYPWPINTLFKMKYIADNIIDADYSFYFNANSEILPIKSYEWFDNDNLILAYHKDWFNNDCHTYKFCEPYMDNPNSTSYIGTTNYTYVQGAFFGGPTKKVLEMCKCINDMITIDLQNNIIPRSHDETYLNKYNYLYDNAYITNVLISEIWNDKNNLFNIDDTQFILLHENIYNLKVNNKASKFEYYIPHQFLKPLYNYDYIYDYKETYKSNYIENTKTKNKNLIVFILIDDINLDDKIKAIKDIYDKLIKKYDIICIHDSRINNFIIKNLYDRFDSNHIFCYDILSLLILNPEHKSQHLFFECENIFNLLINDNYWYNLIQQFNFNKAIFVNKIDEFINDSYYLGDYFNCDSDLLVKEYSVNNINSFNNNDYTKKFNLFKYQYKFKYHLYCNMDNIIISNNAFECLHNYKDEIKYKSITNYYIPSILYNNGYNVTNKN